MGQFMLRKKNDAFLIFGWYFSIMFFFKLQLWLSLEFYSL